MFQIDSAKNAGVRGAGGSEDLQAPPLGNLPSFVRPAPSRGGGGGSHEVTVPPLGGGIEPPNCTVV
jgi:hypothetical protein